MPVCVCLAQYYTYMKHKKGLFKILQRHMIIITCEVFVDSGS